MTRVLSFGAKLTVFTALWVGVSEASPLVAPCYRGVPFFIELSRSSSWCYAFDLEALETWDRYVLVYIPWPGNGTYGDNGYSEFGGWPTDEELRSVYGEELGWGSSALAMCITEIAWSERRIYESDVFFNPSFYWTSEPIWQGQVWSKSPVYSYQAALLHELGHTWGMLLPDPVTQIDTETYCYSVPTVMHGYSANVPPDMGVIHAPDARLMRRHYKNQVTIRAMKDIGVCGKYPDDWGHWSPSTTDKSLYYPGDLMSLHNVLVENTGTEALSDVHIRIYLNHRLSFPIEGETLIAEFEWETFPAESWGVYDFDGIVVPNILPQGNLFVVAKVTRSGHHSDDIGANDSCYLFSPIRLGTPILWTYTLDVAVQGEGTTEPSPGMHRGYEEGSVAVIEAKPAVGWCFAGWTGEVSSSNNPLLLPMAKNTQICASFVQHGTCTLTTGKRGEGSITPSPGTYTFTRDSEVLVGASTIAGGWRFDHWEGAATGSDPGPREVVLDNNKAVTAVFAYDGTMPRYVLTVQNCGNGSVVGPDGATHALPWEGTYNSNAVVGLSPKPASGWVFDHWQGDVTWVSGTNAASVHMDSDKTIVAVFEPAQLGQGWEKVNDSPSYGPRTAFAATTFKDRLWVLGGVKDRFTCLNDIWSSADGRQWTQVSRNAPWHARSDHSALSFAEKLWVLGGGYTDSSGRYHDLSGDVWRSADGCTWEQVTPNVPIGASIGHASFVYLDRMWIAGGIGREAIWHSADGFNWTQETPQIPDYEDRMYSAYAVHNGLIWLTGGFVFGDGLKSDVWSSRDGVHWSQAQTTNAWSPRQGHAMLSCENRLWLLGGNNASSKLNDVWSSTNGTEWTVACASAPWSPQTQFTAVAFHDAIWVLGGSDTGNDIWASRLNPQALRWALIVTVDPPNTGSVSVAPVSGQDGRFENGTMVDLTAVPVTGYVFDGWENEALEGNPAQIQMDGDKYPLARFQREPPIVYFPKANSTCTEGGGTVTVTLELSESAEETVTVHCHTDGGTATNGVDYWLETDTVVFGPGEQSANLAITIPKDTNKEPDETIVLTLAAPLNAVLDNRCTHIVNVADDDSNGEWSGAKLLQTRVAEEVFPPSGVGVTLGESEASAQEYVSIRVTADDPVDPETVWASVNGANLVKAIWRMVDSSEARDGWIMVSSADLWAAGESVTVTVGARTTSGKTVGPFYAVFGVLQDFVRPRGEAPDMLEVEALRPLPDFVAKPVSPVYRIQPMGVFPQPVTVQIPVPGGENPEELDIFYYSESQLHRGWYRGEDVQGWIVPESRTVIGSNGETYVEVQVNHSGVLQLGRTTKVQAGSLFSINVAASGSPWRWLAVIVSWLLLLAVLLGTMRRKDTIREPNVNR